MASLPPPLRPTVGRQRSRVPGGFESDTDDGDTEGGEASPTKSSYDDALSHYAHSRNASAANIPHHGEEDRTHLEHEEEGSMMMMDESAMGKRLLDVESSFMPEMSPLAAERRHDVDEDTTVTYRGSRSPLATPPSQYKTPAPHHPNTSALETMSSSPTAAAAARTVSRVVSMASMEGYETAEEDSTLEAAHDNDDQDDYNSELATPRLDTAIPPLDTLSLESPTPTKPQFFEGDLPEPQQSSPSAAAEAKARPGNGPRKRPTYLSSRFASQRSSYSSQTTSISTNSASMEGASDLTVGLQTGAGLPPDSNASGNPSQVLSRSISLGSVASGVSRLDDVSANLDLDPLPEEYVFADPNLGPPQTPRVTSYGPDTPTDTVINQHVRDFEVPGTIARRFFDKEGNQSPERKAGLPTPAGGRVKNLTLREQSSLIDKLQKENWKLKLKLYFIDQTLAERSDESVKAMISENVELKTYKFSSSKEIRALKRSIRELEYKLKERDETIAANSAAARETPRQSSSRNEGVAELETEVTFMRERIESYEVEMDKLRTENMAKEGEKRRLAEMVKTVGERGNGTGDFGVREEVDMWKDLLEAETARKEQADEENRRLREEIWKMKSDAASSSSINHYNDDSSRRQDDFHYDDSKDLNGVSSAGSTLVEQLKHENAELRREVGAQTSMLTSRNREKERLYQEIEDLKMGQRRGDGSRSVAGDSILDRSVSRAHVRSASRTSSQTRVTQIGDSERDQYESANGELRDHISKLKLENSELARQCDTLLDELDLLAVVKADYDKLEQIHEEMTEQTNTEILAMQKERDEALQLQEESELNFQDLKAEAQERIDGLEEELNQNGDVMRQLEQEIAARDEESNALRNEVRMTSEGLDKVEADVQNKVRRIKELELENEDITRELEGIEKTSIEVNAKNEKLLVELESRQSECAFLREEQDGCMLKIGDLENSLKAVQTGLESEKERAKDLEARLADERHQREVIGGKEKQEVQKIMNDLNRDAAGAKDESRKLRKSLETRETELASWKERLLELEAGLKEVLGGSSGSKSSFIITITKMQRELENTSSVLQTTKHALAEREMLLQRRDALLESHGLESRKLSELLEKERSARRNDKAQHEQWQKTHYHTSRTVTQKDGRIGELEAARAGDRKKMASAEQAFREQLGERNALLLSLWSKLSGICGSDWHHQNKLVSGHLPTLDVVANMLPAFSRNLLAAVKTIDGLVAGFRVQVKAIERDLTKDYQQLEHNLDLRIKRLDRLEAAVQVSKVSGAASAAPEIAKLRGENRLLRADIATLRKQEQVRAVATRQDSMSIQPAPSALPPFSSTSKPGSGGRRAPSLVRHHTTSAVETTLERSGSRASAGSGGPFSSIGGGGSYGYDQTAAAAAAAAVVQSNNNNANNNSMGAPLPQIAGGAGGEPTQQRWIHRLRELEKRLKAEREARLLDRSGARKRLEEGRAETEELRRELEREKERHRGGGSSGSGMSAGSGGSLTGGGGGGGSGGGSNSTLRGGGSAGGGGSGGGGESAATATAAAAGEDGPAAAREE